VGVTVALVDIPLVATYVGAFVTAKLTLASGAGTIRGGFAVLLITNDEHGRTSP